MKNVVVRVQRIKFKNLKQALRHRLKGGNEESIEKLYTKLRQIETENGKRNLRKNASLVEFVLAFEDRLSEEDLKEEIKSFFSTVEKITDIPTSWRSVYFVHEKNGRTHVHILIVPRRWNGKKVNISPGIYKQIVQEYAPHMLGVIFSKRIGVYPLQLIRELERRHGKEWAKEFVKLCRKHEVKKSHFKAVVMAHKERELYEELKRLDSLVYRAKEEVGERRKRRELGL